MHPTPHQKIRLLLSVFFTITLMSLSYGQLSPYFETTLYFEDAIGNRDSVIFGYDINASSGLDPEFGEVEITEPFDSVFEVRMRPRDDTSNDYFTKRLISGTEIVVNDPSCYSGSLGEIYIHALHQPVKVWWDREQFQSSECFAGAFIIDHILHELAGPIALDDFPPLYYCMGDVDTGYFELTEESLDPEYPRICLEKEVEGFGFKKIYGLRLAVGPTWAYTPCYWVVNTTEAPRPHYFSSYPNPVTDQVEFSLDPNANIEYLTIYDSEGQQVMTLPYAARQKVDIGHLPPGCYYISGTDVGNGNRYLSKIVKL